jgi:hypothetical protein
LKWSCSTFSAPMQAMRDVYRSSVTVSGRSQTNGMQCSVRCILPSSKIRTEGYRYVSAATPAAECISTTKHLSTFLFKPSLCIHLRCHHLTSVLAPYSSPRHATEPRVICEGVVLYWRCLNNRLHSTDDTGIVRHRTVPSRPRYRWYDIL